MDDKLKWYLDWGKRGKPVEYEGKIYFLFGCEVYPDNKILLSKGPIGPSNSKKEYEPVGLVFLDADKCKIT
jgi:hypothetical protein